MKNIFVFLFLTIIILVGIGKPQNNPKLDSVIQAGWGNLNFAVPESPSFKILGVSPDNIMRPTTTRDISIAIGNYYINNGTTIPKNLSVEISPALFNPKINLIEYQNSITRLWYTSSYSIGTKVNQNGGYDIGVGFKLKLLDYADLRTNKSFLSFLDNVGKITNSVFSDAITKEVQELIKLRNIQADSAYALVDTAFINKKEPIYSEITAKINKYLPSYNELMQSIINYRDSIKASDWNAKTWDLGVATLFSSKDSLIKDLKAPSKLGLWTTYGTPLGQMGQLLAGLNAGLSDDSNGVLNVANGSLGLRVYYGQNETKGFIQGESNFAKSQLPSFQAGIGLETTFAGCIWIDLSLNIKKTGSQPFAFTPGINISYGNAEKVK
jgi:hypothetical protein